jgi:diguanylate cyclase (GGDEF)-like protein
MREIMQGPVARGPAPETARGRRSEGLVTDASANASALRELLAEADRRDRHLWGLVFVSLLVLSAGVVAIFAPNLAWGIESIRLDLRFLPQLLSGLVVLTVLLYSYLFAQRALLRKTRLALLEQVSRADQAMADALIDPLTRAFNRRYLERALAAEVRRTERTGAPLAVAMIDVNDLGVVNNTYGHAEGDRLLQQVATVLQEVFRASDTVVRYGGDEFLVILPETNEAGSEMATKRVLDKVAAHNAARQGTELPIRLSCGAASYAPGRTIEAVIELADQRMYEEKTRSKRDRHERTDGEPHGCVATSAAVPVS